ncbi:MAG: type II secretion system protein GspE, partial [Armatimonadetes bacterium]|nr:type II secretion system protein GspE [Armatimonadota bacterium]
MRLGEMLIDRRLITAEDLDRALELQKERGEKIGKVLVDLGFIAQKDVLAALADQLGTPLVTLEGPPASSPETERLAARFLRQSRAIPYALDGGVLRLAMADPLDFETLGAARAATGLRVEPVLAAEQEILDAIDRHFGESQKQEAAFDAGAEVSEDLEHLRDMASEAPVIRMVNAMIAGAADKRASDIHIEPFEDRVRVRYRIDGVLVERDSPPRRLLAPMISR